MHLYAGSTEWRFEINAGGHSLMMAANSQEHMLEWVDGIMERANKSASSVHKYCGRNKAADADLQIEASDDTSPLTSAAGPAVGEAPVEEATPVATEEAAPIAVEEVIPVVEEATLAVEEAAPVVAAEAALVVEEVSVEEAPVETEEAAPVAVEEVPVAVEEAAPVVEETALVVEEAIPVATEEAAAAAAKVEPVVIFEGVTQEPFFGRNLDPPGEHSGQDTEDGAWESDEDLGVASQEGVMSPVDDATNTTLGVLDGLVSSVVSAPLASLPSFRLPAVDVTLPAGRTSGVGPTSPPPPPIPMDGSGSEDEQDGDSDWSDEDDADFASTEEAEDNAFEGNVVQAHGQNDEKAKEDAEKLKKEEEERLT